MLQLEDIELFRGPNHVLKSLSLAVQPGEIVTLIGANGAGKSSTLLMLSGLLPIRAGQARFSAGGQTLDLRRSKPEAIVRAGLVQCPEGRQVFGRLSVAENLALGAYLQKDKAQLRRSLEQVYGLFDILYERRQQKAGSLSGGEQMMLAVGRALMAQPHMLLLDEPSLGLAPKIVEQIFELIAQLNQEQGMSILLVEQNAMLALELASRAYVIEQGRIVQQGDSRTLLTDSRIQEAYLGGIG